MGGQAFRWVQLEDGWYSGVIRDCLVNVRSQEGGIEYRSNRKDEQVRPLLKSYFRLDDDIRAIHAQLSRNATMSHLINKYPGLRLLRQEPWECLVAYCCSAPNSVHGITRLVQKLSSEFGNRLTLDGQINYTFPSPVQLAGLSEMELRGRGFGLHAPRVFTIACAVSNGCLDLAGLREASYPKAKGALMKFRGISHKVASCVSLFLLDKLEAFPVDRNISRALVKYCFADLRETQLRTLEKRGESHFGQYAGYAGQLLFHDIRHLPQPSFR